MDFRCSFFITAPFLGGASPAAGKQRETHPNTKKRGIFMGEIIEEFFNGYCRNFDMTQTVICEFEQFPEGLRLLDSSCEYGVCQYSKDCTLMKQALAREKE